MEQQIAALESAAAEQDRCLARIELRLTILERQHDLLERRIAAEIEPPPKQSPDMFDIDDTPDIADFVAARKKALEEKSGAAT